MWAPPLRRHREAQKHGYITEGQIGGKSVRPAAPTTVRADAANGLLTPDRVTAEKIEAHQRARLADGVSAGTIKEEVTQLLAVLKRAQRGHALGSIPYVQHVTRKAQKTPSKPRAYLPWPKIADVVAALRPRALGRVTVDMVDLALGRIVVPAVLMKENPYAAKVCRTCHRDIPTS